jgi:CoA:oxalate CoA-transferase
MQYTRIAEMLGTGELPRPLGSRSPGLVPDGAYAALDGEVFVTAHTDAEWRGFCAALERPELAADPRFATNALRVTHRAALDALVEPIVLARPMLWWMRAFERHRVPCALAQQFEQLRYHTQVRDNAMIADVDTGEWGRVVVGGMPWAFAVTPGAIAPPPTPGADTARVLADLARRQADAAARSA